MNGQLKFKPKTVAEYVDWQIDLCGKSQRQIAEEAGFAKPNIITMFKKGDTKIPLEKIGPIAKALEVDPIHFFKMCMQEYQPDTWTELQKLFNQPVLTVNEIEIIETIRCADVTNPRLRTDDDRQRLLGVINTLKPDNATN